VVFPRADCKFYLDASLEARARRRLADRRAADSGEDLAGIREAIATRDRADQTRAVAPLARAPDATYIDSSEMTVDEVVELMAKETERPCSTRS
jgi:cytidylate kinase